MDLNEFRVPPEKAAPTGPDAGPWRTTAHVAGFRGALPFGLLPLYLMTEWKRPFLSTSEYLFWGLLGTLPLVPFAVAVSRAGRGAWSRTLTLVIPATVIGAVSVVSYFFLGVTVYLAAGGLGLLLGVAAVGPCWWRGDHEGRALALLGPAPALWLLGCRAADPILHRPAGLTAALDLSGLWRWEYLLALVAVGIAAGALRLLWLRLRLAQATRMRGLDAAGVDNSCEADSPGRETPTHETGGEGGRVEQLRRHARVLGGVWILYGSILLLIGGGHLWDGLPPLGSVPDDWELRQLLSLAALAAYGLALAASGVGTCRRSQWAIGTGLALSCVALALGFAVNDRLFAVSFIALALALIYLALRTLGLARPHAHGPESRRGFLAALRRVPTRLAEAPTSRLAVAVLGCSLGGTVGSIAGAIAGGLLMTVAVMAHLVTNQWGLAPIGGLAIGVMAGGVGGWVGGLIQGATRGVSSPRLKAVRLYAGMSSGLIVVLVEFVRSGALDWSRWHRWFELLEILLLAAATGAVGAVSAGASVGRLARAFADRKEGRAGALSLDD